ncbi:MAG TPA: hypothetical protein PLD23_22400, partial [Armatimonadota bacterium]|nr:hypothetical protein [Armatimonadota bacterium]
DAARRPLLARRPVGHGALLLGSRGLCGRQPDASDPINASWLQPLLAQVASGKAVDANRPPESMPPENAVERGGLRIRYNDYMRPYADTIFDLYSRERPVLESILGVPPASGMLTSLILLPTGGGGFSSGTEIGLGVFWGGFPEKSYGMIELLAHEATHSWVLPFPEPMWNEGIASYVGILAGRGMGEAEAADETLKGWIDNARRDDPDFSKLDIAHGTGVPHSVAMAKPMWIFEQLRTERPDILARYFQAKRQLIDPGKVDDYTADDAVAVLSIAMERDLFPWFKSLGITVDRAKTALPVP